MKRRAPRGGQPAIDDLKDLIAVKCTIQGGIGVAPN